MDDTPADAYEAVLLEKIEDAKQHLDVASLCTILVGAHALAPLLVMRCCDALDHVVRHDRAVCTAAVARGAIRHVLRAIEDSASVVSLTSCWALLRELVNTNVAFAAQAVDGGALELALTSIRLSENDTMLIVASSALRGLTLDVGHATRAVELGAIEVYLAASAYV